MDDSRALAEVPSAPEGPRWRRPSTGSCLLGAGQDAAEQSLCGPPAPGWGGALRERCVPERAPWATQGCGPAGRAGCPRRGQRQPLPPPQEEPPSGARAIPAPPRHRLAKLILSVKNQFGAVFSAGDVLPVSSEAAVTSTRIREGPGAHRRGSLEERWEFTCPSVARGRRPLLPASESRVRGGGRHTVGSFVTRRLRQRAGCGGARVSLALKMGFSHASIVNGSFFMNRRCL